MTISNGPAITVAPAAELPGSLRGALHQLFDQSYAQADHGYLDKSLDLLRYVAVAAADDATGQAAAGTSGREQIIGFALGETQHPGPARPALSAGGPDMRGAEVSADRLTALEAERAAARQKIADLEARLADRGSCLSA